MSTKNDSIFKKRPQMKGTLTVVQQTDESAQPKTLLEWGKIWHDTSPTY